MVPGSDPYSTHFPGGFDQFIKIALPDGAGWMRGQGPPGRSTSQGAKPAVRAKARGEAPPQLPPLGTFGFVDQEIPDRREEHLLQGSVVDRLQEAGHEEVLALPADHLEQELVDHLVRPRDMTFGR
ncbi:hypothetical protein ACFYVW_30860 [Streptomyces tendae]|uniref:hypothetical protein n=1 Tax=Streptomyces tendae TaxID=1932 RepID=UPI003699B05A